LLDVLINNAGIPGAYPQSAEAAPASVVRQVFETNFFGVIEVTQAFLDLLKIN
jgi:NAD(P)-dependent dehydrogenase (short-subunit alcohol dehydrogenase family)